MWLLLLAFFLLTGNISFAQNTKIDSLLTSLSHSKEDTNKVNTLIDLSKELINTGNYDRAKKYAIEIKTLAEKIEFKKGTASAFRLIGVVCYQQGNYEEAHRNFLLSLKIFQEIGDKKGIALCYNNVGIIYEVQGNYSDALKNYFDALTIFKQFGESKNEIAGIYSNIGIIYSRQKNYSEALKNFLRSLEIQDEIGNFDAIAYGYNNIGILYEDMDKYQDALKYHLLALKIWQKKGDKAGIAASYLNIGGLNTKQKKFDDARKHLNDALQLSKVIDDKDNLKECYNAFAELSEAIGDYKNAYEYHKLYSEIKDTLLNENNNKQIAEMKTKYETEKKDKEITILNSENKIKEAEIKKQKIIKYGAVSLAALILLMTFVGFNNIRIKNKAAQLAKANQVRQKISRDLHDEIGSGLTTICMICEQAETKLEDKETVTVSALSDRIKIQTHNVNQKLRELVWAANPENDNLQVMFAYMRNYVFKYFDNSSIAYSLNLPDEVPALSLKADVSRNLIFVLKEALNNCIKHSQATEIGISFSISNKNYIFEIVDNGIGINYDCMPIQHSGLDNMRKRIEDIKGKFEIISENGKGTCIEINGNFG